MYDNMGYGFLVSTPSKVVGPIFSTCCVLVVPRLPGGTDNRKVY